MNKQKAIPFILILGFILLLTGCVRRTGLGTYTQEIKAGGTPYSVKIANIGQDRYGGTSVGVQSIGSNGFKNIPQYSKPPIGAYIVNGDDEYRYNSYDIDNDTIIFQFESGIDPDRIIVYPEAFSDDVLTHKAFDGKSKEAVRFYVPEKVAIDLDKLIKQKRVSAKVTGRSLYRSAITITNYHSSVLPVKIGVGLWFDSVSYATQNMVVTRDVCFVVEPHKSYTVMIPVACMNYDRNIPDKADSFNIGKINYTSQYRELMPLIKLLRKNDVSDEVIQLAVWVLTDDNVDDMVNNLDEYFGSTGLQNNILRFVDRLLGTGLASDFDSDEIKTTKKIIRQVHKPKSGIKIKR